MIAHQERAQRRLYAASEERDRRRKAYESAIGTPFEADARTMLREAAEHFCACRKLVDEAKRREVVPPKRATQRERIYQL